MGWLSAIVSGRTGVCRFRSDTRGSFTPLFAVCLIPMLAVAGGAIDLTRLYRIKTMIESSADSAAVTAVGANVVDPRLGDEEQKRKSARVAQTQLRENLLQNRGDDVILMFETYSAEMVDFSLTMKICWEARMKTAFLHLIGMKELRATGCSESNATAAGYVAVYFLVDASGSMGVGASERDQQIMKDKTGCTFACHTIDWKSKITAGCREQTPTCALHHGAKTRFMVVQEALKKVLAAGQTKARRPDQYKFAIYTFSNELRQVMPLSSDYAALNAAVDGMTQDPSGGTNFSRALNELNAIMPTPGNGKTARNAKVALLVLTDGVEGNVLQIKDLTHINMIAINLFGGRNELTVQYNGNWRPDPSLEIQNPGFFEGSERSQAINPSNCEPIKARGIRIGTLNTEYLVPAFELESRFVRIRNSLAPVIADTMRQCATSPEDALLATSPEDVKAATKKLFDQLLGQPARLTR